MSKKRKKNSSKKHNNKQNNKQHNQKPAVDRDIKKSDNASKDIKAFDDVKADKKSGNFYDKSKTVNTSDKAYKSVDIPLTSTEEIKNESSSIKAESEKETITKAMSDNDSKESGFKHYMNSLKDDIKLERNNMKQMNSLKERISYFMFYHKWHVLIALVFLVAFVYFIVNVFISKKPVYYCIVVNDSYNQEFKNELNTELNDVIELNPSKEKVEIGLYSTDISHYEPGYYGGDGGAQGIFSLMMDYLIDTMIAEPDEMEWFSMDNNFCNLKEILPSDLYETIEPDIVMLKDSTGEEKPYAIDISNTELYKKGQSNLKNPCVGIFSTTRNLDESIEFIEHIYDYNAK